MQNINDPTYFMSEAAVDDGFNLHYAEIKNVHWYGLPIILNPHLDYYNLLSFLSRDFSGVVWEFETVFRYKNQMTDREMRALVEYCFEFDTNNFEKSRFIPLTATRLVNFETK
jgi:hypothetical protein